MTLIEEFYYKNTILADWFYSEKSFENACINYYLKYYAGVPSENDLLKIAEQTLKNINS
jgi:hypothetical protein